MFEDDDRRHIAADAIEHMLAEWEFMMRTGPDPGPLADFLASKLDEQGLLA